MLVLEQLSWATALRHRRASSPQARQTSQSELATAENNGVCPDYSSEAHAQSSHIQTTLGKMESDSALGKQNMSRKL